MKLPCFIARQQGGTWKCNVCGARASGPLDSVMACPNRKLASRPAADTGDDET